jgi:hypothetical protein
MTLRENVKAGAAYLDRAVPDWADKINLENLDLGNGRYCILGQLGPCYLDSPHYLNLGYKKCIDYGFALDSDNYYGQKLRHQDYTHNIETLTMIWKEEINSRKLSSPIVKTDSPKFSIDVVITVNGRPIVLPDEILVKILSLSLPEVV